MTLEGQVLDQRTRADRVRSRRVRVQRPVEPVDRKRKSKPKGRTRRRTGIAVATPRGAEIRIPSLGLKVFGARWLSLALLALSVVLLVRAVQGQQFVVGELDISGNTFIPASQIRSVTDLNGKLIFLINPEEVVDQLEKLPEVQSAEVEIHWMNLVSVHITERPPMVEWNDGGRTWWVGAEGIAYSPQGENPGLIRVDSAEPFLNIQVDPTLPALAPELVQTAVELKAALPLETALSFDEIHGFSIQTANGTQVYFGFGEDIQIKIRVYQAIAAALEERNQTVGVISVEDASSPYYRWE